MGISKNRAIAFGIVSIFILSICLLCGCSQQQDQKAKYDLNTTGNFKGIEYKYDSNWRESKGSTYINYAADSDHDVQIYTQESKTMTADKFYEGRKNNYMDTSKYKDVTFKDISKGTKEVNGWQLTTYEYSVKYTSVSNGKQSEDTVKAAYGSRTDGFVWISVTAKNGNTDTSLFDDFIANVKPLV